MRAQGETHRHAELKRLALAWSQDNGYPLCAPEVRVPRSGYRADVAASARGVAPRTALFECKQSRADLLRDAHAEAATRSQLDLLNERRRTLEGLFAVHRPDLRRGEALWPEYDTWDFSTLEHDAYRSVLAELETVQRRIVRGTKFSKMFRYRCADVLYLVIEDGIFAEAEIPAGWGVLIRRGDRLETARRPVELGATVEQRTALLQSIAAAGTRAVNRAYGLTFSPPGWTSTEMPET
ncbi:MAG TPA: hypothetical protein VHE61_20345 [Opitutaceae bacterium]|nr:hypothetical protein [Opitutaceae bacterium]